MIRGKMMSYFTYRRCPQPIYKYILSRFDKKVKKFFKEFLKDKKVYRSTKFCEKITNSHKFT